MQPPYQLIKVFMQLLPHFLQYLQCHPWLGNGENVTSCVISYTTRLTAPLPHHFASLCLQKRQAGMLLAVVHFPVLTRGLSVVVCGERITWHFCWTKPAYKFTVRPLAGKTTSPILSYHSTAVATWFTQDKVNVFDNLRTGVYTQKIMRNQYKAYWEYHQRKELSCIFSHVSACPLPKISTPFISLFLLALKGKLQFTD